MGSTQPQFIVIASVKSLNRNLEVVSIRQIHEISKFDNFHLYINQKVKNIKYTCRNQFFINFECESPLMIFGFRGLVLAEKSISYWKYPFPRWNKSPVKYITVRVYFSSPPHEFHLSKKKFEFQIRFSECF